MENSSDSSPSVENVVAPLNGGVSRRSFVRRAAIGASMLPLAGLFGSGSSTFGQGGGGVTAGDIAILKFLAAAELVEADLWGQYCELAVNNPGYRRELTKIDEAIVAYICDDFQNEQSHADFINGYLVSIGQQPVNLDAFRTLPSSRARGARQIGRLTSLAALTVDTSWYNRYRQQGNPDFGDTFPQIATIVNQPTIPLGDDNDRRGDDDEQLRVTAASAAFHFCAIEQGGSSLYSSLLTKVSSLDVLAIVGSIGPVEFYQFGTFQTSLEGIRGARNRNTNIPDLARNTDVARATLPEPCKFFATGLPLCSVLRPRSTARAGAVAAATGLVNSGLFTGQSSAFLGAVVQLAQAADAATRTC